ncbi:MAG: DegV family protein [Eubacteriales bacterium]|nr:DegV family protein [Eubacteriales bacterium]
MNRGKIAILVDSGTDVPREYKEKHHIYMAPLKIIYRDREYDDRHEITPQEVYARLEDEVPCTSLPDSGLVTGLFDQIAADGFDTVLVITISSRLSGTHNLLRVLSEDYQGLDFHFVDTRNIGIGAGLQAMLAAQLIGDGEDIAGVVAKLELSITNSRTYFCLDTLEYLIKGGRIGKVMAVVGQLLHIRPVISCNEEGVYVTVAKARGAAQAVEKAIALAVRQASSQMKFAIAVAHGSAVEKANAVMRTLKERIPNAAMFLMTDISPALSVHTGPGLIGIAVQSLPA